MKTPLSPEDLKVRIAGRLQYADAWGLTCAQLGLSVSELLKNRPTARLTREDLVGYHYTQYGMDGDIIRETIEGVEEGMWGDWIIAQALRTTLPALLSDKTQDAVAQRIRIGSPANAEKLLQGTALTEHFEVTAETDHSDSEVVSLYPNENTELTYRGRTTLAIGTVLMHGTITDMTVYADVLGVNTADAPHDRSLVAMSTNQGYPPEIQSIRVV